MTGNQKSRAVNRNEKCSTRCQVGDRSASSYITGTCQATLTEIKADQQKRGCDTNRAIFRRPLDDRKGPIPLIENCRGRPESNGRYGAPQRIIGGATIINNKC